MHISTRIQRCWSELSSVATKTDEEVPRLLKVWISTDLAHVSSRLEELVASSNTMQFILKAPASEVHLDQIALLALKKAAAVPAITSDQEKFFRQVESMLHEIVCPEYDSCWQCQSRRYILVETGSQALRVACSCCGHVSSLNSNEYIELVAPSIPTRSQLAGVRNVN
jgi:hypothetical protein